MPGDKMPIEACTLQTTPGPYLQVLGAIWRQMTAHRVCRWEAIRKKSWPWCMKNNLDISLPFDAYIYCFLPLNLPLFSNSSPSL